MSREAKSHSPTCTEFPNAPFSPRGESPTLGHCSSVTVFVASQDVEVAVCSWVLRRPALQHHHSAIKHKQHPSSQQQSTQYVAVTAFLRLGEEGAPKYWGFFSFKPVTSFPTLQHLFLNNTQANKGQGSSLPSDPQAALPVLPFCTSIALMGSKLER